jgi:PadR family transcriptional regulator AphA
MRLKPTGYVILGILAIHPDQSGYEIRKTIQQSVGFFWGESFGQIYPTLKHLGAEGLIELSGTASRTKKPRNEYSITPAGRASLQEWLAIPFEDDPPRNQFLLKLFFAESAGTAVAKEQLRQFEASTRKFLATVQALEVGAKGHGAQFPGFPYWMLTLDYGVRQLETALQWSKHAQATLDAMESKPAADLSGGQRKSQEEPDGDAERAPVQ